MFSRSSQPEANKLFFKCLSTARSLNMWSFIFSAMLSCAQKKKLPDSLKQLQLITLNIY